MNVEDMRVNSSVYIVIYKRMWYLKNQYVPIHLVCDRIPCVSHTACLSSFNKALLCRETHRGVKWAHISSETLTWDTNNKNHTDRYVGKGTAVKRCPDVFCVRVPNNGRVLAAAINHQVVHVAFPRHVCEISSTIKKRRTVTLWLKRLSDDQQNCKEAVLSVVWRASSKQNPPAL